MRVKIYSNIKHEGVKKYHGYCRSKQKIVVKSPCQFLSRLYNVKPLSGEIWIY